MGNRRGVANSLGSLGNAYYRLGDYKKAIDYHQQHLAISKEIGNRQGVANSLGNLGNAYHSLGNYKKAIDYHQQYLAISKEIGNRRGVAVSLNNLGLALQKSGKLVAAENHLRQAITTYEDIRKLLLNKDTWKVSIFEQQARTYRLLQQVLIARKQPQQALVISEQGRTRALVEILYRTRHNKPKQELIPPTLTLTQIQQVANKEKATLVEYFVTLNEIYIWVISPQGKIKFRSVSLPKDISIQQLVKITREKQLNVRGRNSNNPPGKKDSSTNRLKQLHQLLIKPIADLLPKDEQQKVIFIPHQELFLVPFVALQDEKDKYLIEKHTILTAPSIQALSLNPQNKQTAPILPRGKDVLIVGNPTMPKTKVGKKLEPLKQLDGAEEEAKIIAKMLGTKAIIGSQATEPAIVKKMSSAKLIHFATHGLLDGINAIGSPGAITFTPFGKDDGFLTTSEIMEKFGLSSEQKLQADLVVLSACDTGRGDIRGEGVIGLSRAFMASGVPTLVVSLWKVSL
ncbi:CHAT domain-containing protein, partial [Calothrix rhizosoleniae]|uniref:CHAT domain-containing protein n=1 Tax=Calothrix rhizosoleniae TaxID=888997 RepID=UPI001F167164